MAIDFFADESDQPPHPLLRSWSRRIDRGQTAVMQVDSPRALVGLSQPRIYLEFSQDGNVDITDEANWDQTLNTGLLKLRVRCIDVENEAERFCLALRDGLQSFEKEYGNGYFNAVLLDLIKESGLDGDAEINDVLKYTYHDVPERNSKSYNRCRESLALGISARANELRKQLGYSEDEARIILTRSLARYLDERFSVSSRRQLGLL